MDDHKEKSSSLWEPLIEKLGVCSTLNYMFMYISKQEGGLTLYSYKHIHTRIYIHLDKNGVEYNYSPETGKYNVKS